MGDCPHSCEMIEEIRLNSGEILHICKGCGQGAPEIDSPVAPSNDYMRIHNKLGGIIEELLENVSHGKDTEKSRVVTLTNAAFISSLINLRRVRAWAKDLAIAHELMGESTTEITPNF